MTKWWVIGAAAFLGTLLITSITFALLSEETVFEPGTPERAVQDLLRAAEDDDIEAAYAMLSDKLQANCALRNFADRSYRSDDQNIRASLRETKSVDDVTFVTVRVSQYYGDGPFGGSESSRDRRFVLRQEGGEWKFTEYPWPYNWCPESDSE